MSTIIELRHATRADGTDVAAIYLESFSTTLPHIRLAHSEAECREHFSTTVIDNDETWVACVADDVVGFCAFGATRLNHLYLRPESTGRGIGQRLLRLAKYRRPGGLDLWAFEANAGARRFYERHGFVAVEHGDGTGNEEGEPDVRYAWRPSR